MIGPLQTGDEQSIFKSRISVLADFVLVRIQRDFTRLAVLFTTEVNDISDVPAGGDLGN